MRAVWGLHTSPWPTANLSTHEKLNCDLKADVCIVGAGITGLTAAHFLSEMGKRVVVLTQGRVGEGTTGHSTGHLTYVPDIYFSDLVSKFGRTTALQVITSMRHSIDTVEALSLQNRIDCDFSRIDGYLLASQSDQIHRLEKEVKTALDLGISTYTVEKTPLPFANSIAARFSSCAQFNPWKYLQGLSQSLKGKVSIFEHTHVKGYSDGSPACVTTENGSVTCKDIVLATHTPIGTSLSLQTRVAAYNSYVMTIETEESYPPALYWDLSSPYFYLRMDNGSPSSKRWIIGGCDKKTGQVEDDFLPFEKLEEFIKARFQNFRYTHFWNAELFEPVDGLAYIGKLPHSDNIFVATGYSGTGLTLGTLAGEIISDLILEKENYWAKLYDPSRMTPLASATKFTKENINVARHFVGDRFGKGEISSVEEVGLGEGHLLNVDGQKVAVYRSHENRLYAFSPVCQHMGCLVGWNDVDDTWDCPCHGGRYKATGEVFYGPPLEGLKPVEIRTGAVVRVPPAAVENSLPPELGDRCPTC